MLINKIINRLSVLSAVILCAACDYVGIVEDRIPVEGLGTYAEWDIGGTTLSGAFGTLVEIPLQREYVLHYKSGTLKGELAGSLRLVEYADAMPSEWPVENYGDARFIFDQDANSVRMTLGDIDYTRPHALTLIYKEKKRYGYAHLMLVPQNEQLLPKIDSLGVCAVISDIHLNDLRAQAYGHSWFIENKSLLLNYLDYLIAHAKRYRELVLLGDVFDEYVTPAPLLTFADISGNPMSESDYIRSIAEHNQPVIDRLKAVQDAGITLVYVPGNHDMGATEADIRAIFGDRVVQARDVAGLGTYIPDYAPSVVMEHSHRYDVMCAPDPLSNIGIDSVSADNAFLPAGYFTTRIGATYAVYGRKKTDLSYYNLSASDLTNTRKSGTDAGNRSILKAVWSVVSIAKPLDNLSSTPMPTGLNGLTADYTLYDYSFLGKANPLLYSTMYKQSEWEQRLERNHAPKDFPFVLGAVFCEVPDIHYLTAVAAYGDDADKRVVVFGHTHQPELSIRRAKGAAHSFVYANSGSWVDKKACTYDVGTYVEIYSGLDGYERVSLRQWTGDGYRTEAPDLWVKTTRNTSGNDN